MVETMHKLTRFSASSAAIALAASAGALAIDNPTASAAPTVGNGTTRVPLRAIQRACDFSAITDSLPGPGEMNARGTAYVHTAVSDTVLAKMRFVNTDQPNTHYDVGLIEVPRPSSSPCGPGAAGTAHGGLDTDAAGRATVTFQSGIRPGATGVWVAVQRPEPHSQTPVEYYTSDFVTSV